MTQEEFDEKIKDLEQLEIDLYKRYTTTSAPAYSWTSWGIRIAGDILSDHDTVEVAMAVVDFKVAFYDTPYKIGKAEDIIDEKIKDLEQFKIDLGEQYLETSRPAYFWAKTCVQIVQDILSGHDIAKAKADLDMEVAKYDTP